MLSFLRDFFQGGSKTSKTEMATPNQPEEELTAQDVQRMVRVFSWLDYGSFSRKVQLGIGNEIRVTHRTSGPSDSNVIYAHGFAGQKSDEQINLAMKFLLEAGVEDISKISREHVLKLRAHLTAKFGNEGAKRFSELSFIANAQRGQTDPTSGAPVFAEIWGDFRTFLDVEHATQRGLPFDIEHFLGRAFFINDASGPRVRHINGSGFEPSQMRQYSRTDRSGF